MIFIRILILGNIIGSLNGLGSLAIKTLISKLIPEDERGKEIFYFENIFIKYSIMVKLLCSFTEQL